MAPITMPGETLTPASTRLVGQVAIEGKGEDRDGYRAEFAGLVEKARALAR